jgi:hypothetical protein
MSGGCKSNLTKFKLSEVIALDENLKNSLGLHWHHEIKKKFQIGENYFENIYENPFLRGLSV